MKRFPPMAFENDAPAPARVDYTDRVQRVNVDAAALASALKRSVRGEVRFDDSARAMYATDASNYRQVPIGVVLPKDADDVIATVALAREHGAPILARGGGTSLAGQCCNVAVVSTSRACSRASSLTTFAMPPRSIASPSVPTRPPTAAARSAG